MIHDSLQIREPTNVSTVSANESTCVICHKDHDGQWIQCDQCENWVHSMCVNLNEKEVDMIDKYFCNNCELRGRGRTTRKRPHNLHRYDSLIDDDKMELKTQVGTFKFIEDLKKMKFKNMNEKDITMNGEDLKMKFLKKNGFYKPILVRKKDHLDMKLPKDFSYDMLIKALGPDHKLEVINVNHQSLENLTLAEFIKKFRSTDRPKTYNCISLELSQTELSKHIQPPKIVRKMSWADRIFEEDDRPAVSKYCLLSMKDSYTDFHIDFSGTSVWYHVIEGEKRFFFIEPTEKNIDMYETWQRTDDNNEHFLPDLIGHDRCFEFTLQPGDTMFIPAGWIHAVLTPIDSVVFGGNYLQTWGAHLQIRVYEGELRCGFLDKFKFPLFKLTHWCATWFVYTFLKNLCDKGIMTKKSVTENSVHRNLFKSFESFREFTLKFHEEFEEARKKWKKSKSEDDIKTIIGSDYKDREEFEAILNTYESHNYLTSLKNMKEHYLDTIRPDSELIQETKNEHSTATLNNLELPQKSVNLKRKDQDQDAALNKKVKSEHSSKTHRTASHRSGQTDNVSCAIESIERKSSVKGKQTDYQKERSSKNQPSEEHSSKELKDLPISQLNLSPKRIAKNFYEHHSPSLSNNRKSMTNITPEKKAHIPCDLIAGGDSLRSFKIPKKSRSKESTPTITQSSKNHHSNKSD